MKLDQAINTWGPVDAWSNFIQSIFLSSISSSDLTYETTLYIISISSNKNAFCLLPKSTRHAIVLLTKYLFSTKEEQTNWDIYDPNLFKFDPAKESVVSDGEFFYSKYAGARIYNYMCKLNKETYDSLIEDIINGQIAYDVIKS